MLLMLAVVPAATADSRFTLGLDRFAWQPRDPRTAQRLAEWNAPLGRTALALAELQARMIGGPQPRPSAQAVVRVKVQRGLPLQLVTAIQSGGIELAESSVAAIRWPWDERSLEPPLSVEEQIVLLLGRRLAPSRDASP